ncbi:MAG: ribulose-phosphate 3-epimerase, partial [Candidatus Latescibacterota bacterium]|nr:ribulose-phosphate 3-epimerase [Candidatus Latescibacterota bacterium]
MSIKIAPSFLAADFLNLEKAVRDVEEAGVEYIHLDVMDGHFVPNISFGAIVVEALRKHTDLVLDVHLMITNPEDYIRSFADAGTDIFNFHQEVEGDLSEVIGKVKEAGMKTGLTIKPATTAETLFPHLSEL